MMADTITTPPASDKRFFTTAPRALLASCTPGASTRTTLGWESSGPLIRTFLTVARRQRKYSIQNPRRASLPPCDPCAKWELTEAWVHERFRIGACCKRCPHRCMILRWPPGPPKGSCVSVLSTISGVHCSFVPCMFSSRRSSFDSTSVLDPAPSSLHEVSLRSFCVEPLSLQGLQLALWSLRRHLGAAGRVLSARLNSGTEHS